MKAKTTARWATAWLVAGGLLAALAAGCGSAPMATSHGGAAPQTVGEQAAALEAEQAAEVEAFDGATAGDDRCGRLCFHLDKICALSTRICALAEGHPGADVAGSCERATKTCDDTTARLPTECACEEKPAP